MSLDDKLKNWREATDSLVPPDRLLAALEAAVEVPTPPAGVGAVVKVLIITAVVGAIGVAVLHAQQTGWGWFAKQDPVATAAVAPTPAAARGPGVAPVPAAAAVEAPCGPRSDALVAVPGFSAQEERARFKQAMHLLTKRPLNCLAQRHPLEQLLWARPTNDAELVRLSSRLGYLCGAPSVPQWPLFRNDSACDDSDWCHAPTCALGNEACASSWAARPEGSCAHRSGTRALISFACVRFLRGQGTEAQVRSLAEDAWCLKPEALQEREYLHHHDAGMELP